MSLFDPDEFLAKTHKGKMALFRPPVPEGSFEMEVSKLEPDEIPVKNKDTGKEEPRVILDVTYTIKEVDEVTEVTGRETNFVRQRIWINEDEDTEELSMDDNSPLANLRDAAGQLDQEEWGVGELLGARIIGTVEHSPSNNPDRPFANVVRTAALV